MAYLLTVVREFEGIVGAILGSVFTLVVTHFLKNSGRIIPYSNNLKFTFFQQDEFGGFREVENYMAAEYGTLIFDLEFYNSSESPKAVRELKIGFYNQNKQFMFSLTPKDEGTRRFVAAHNFRDDLSVVNVPAKQIVHYKIFTFFDKNRCKNYDNIKYIYIEFVSTKGRQKRKLIHLR